MGKIGNLLPPPRLFLKILKTHKGGVRGGGVRGASYVLEKQSSGKLMDFMID